MELLRVQNLDFRIGGHDVLRDVSLTLRSGQRLGLIGDNGVGKTTLLKLLSGELNPDEGQIIRSPGLRLDLLQQGQLEHFQGTVWQSGLQALEHHRALENALREEEKRLSAGEDRLAAYGEIIELFEQAGGYRGEIKLKQTLAALQFGPESYQHKVSHLSGGERARLALALALVNQADILLLDEPSNHLDLQTRNWLAETLLNYPGAIILASHDRALLNKVCTHTAWLAAAGLSPYKGNYADFKQQQNQAASYQNKLAKEQHKNLVRLQRSASRLKPAALKQRQALKLRIRDIKQVPAAQARAEPKLQLNPHRAKGKLLQAQHLSKSFAGQVIVKDASFTLAAGDKIALLGPNGSGKSTLLKLLSAELESDHPESRFFWASDSKVAIFDQQNRGLKTKLSLLAQLQAYVHESRARSLLALVGLGPQHWQKTPEQLSGGEKARAGIALLMASEANLLILDEPTEYLDITMIEKLEQALIDSPAAIVLVTHDEALANSVATRVWALKDGELTEFRGGLPGYLSGNLRLSIDPSEITIVDEVSASENPKDKLENLESEKLKIDELLADPFLLTERELWRLRRRYRELLDELSELYNAALPPPPPRFHKWEGAVSVSSESCEGLSCRFLSNTGFEITLYFPSSERLGHLVLHDKKHSCLLPWALTAMLKAIAKIAFEHLEVRALQMQNQRELDPAGFKSVGNDWWLFSRVDYEQQAGHKTDSISLRKKRLYFHPDWQDWVDYRRWHKLRQRYKPRLFSPKSTKRK